MSWPDPRWQHQKGAFPLNELYMAVLMTLVVFGGFTYGYMTGNWIVIKVLGAWIGTVFIVLLFMGLLEDQRDRKAKHAHHRNLLRYLELAAENGRTGEAREAEAQMLKSAPFMFPRVEPLLERYRKIGPDQRTRARMILLKRVRFNLDALELFLETPVDGESLKALRPWLGCKPEILDDVLKLIHTRFLDPSRGDRENLLTLVIGLAKSMPTPEYASAMKPFRPCLEEHRDGLDKSDRVIVDRYLEYWGAEKEKGFTNFDFLGLIVLIMAIICCIVYGFKFGNWYLLLGVIVLFPLKLLIEGLFFSDSPEEKAIKKLHKKLVRYLDLAAAGDKPDAIEKAEQQVMQVHAYFGGRCRFSEQLLDLYRQIDPDRREQPRMLLLKTTYVSMAALLLFLQAPVNSSTIEAFKNWFYRPWMEPEVLDRFDRFRSSMEGPSGGDRVLLATFLLGLESHPTAEHSAALKPLRSYLEAGRAGLSERERKLLDHYIGIWDAEDR